MKQQLRSEAQNIVEYWRERLDLDLAIARRNCVKRQGRWRLYMKYKN
ncbi:MAG: hypothetical protein SW833_13885 [Cyanobacteriota bacterium]|nr:hypothetical protein [Cyanobacteriota bacterium]